MCGILVWTNKRGKVCPRKMAEALELMAHRGPDVRRCAYWGGEGMERLSQVHPEASGEVPIFASLGHARLSIIDLSESAHQPMFAPSGAALTYNGEIYNYIELRDQVRGEPLHTSSDTEVLLRLLDEQGLDSLSQMNGMWGFGLLQPDKGLLTLARDRYGKKPLFWYSDGVDFIAASECKAIFHILGGRRTINPDFLYGLMIGKHLPTYGDGSWFYKGIHTVLPGGGVELDLRTGNVREFQNNSIEHEFQQIVEPSVELLAEQIDSAVRLRMRSDVPVGVFLSGGIDSGTIAACLASNPDLKDSATFYTLRVKDPEDSVWARRLANDLGLNLKEVPWPEDEQEMGAISRKMLLHYEVPFPYGLVGYPAWVICRAMARDGIRVALDGTGGDEVFSGYPPYYDMAINSAIRSHNPIKAMRLMREEEKRMDNMTFGKAFGRRVKALRRSISPKPAYKTVRSMERAALLAKVTRHVAPQEMMQLANTSCARDLMSDISSMQKADLTGRQMPSYLYMTDMSSMLNSIEVRSPLLDHRLAKYVNLPDKYKFFNGFNKHLLRKAMPACVPDSFRWRKSKAGFTVDQSPAWGKEGTDSLRDMMHSSSIVSELFDVESLLSSHFPNGGQLVTMQEDFLRGVCVLEDSLGLSL